MTTGSARDGNSGADGTERGIPGIDTNPNVKQVEFSELWIGSVWKGQFLRR